MFQYGAFRFKFHSNTTEVDNTMLQIIIKLRLSTSLYGVIKTWYQLSDKHVYQSVTVDVYHWSKINSVTSGEALN
jgi:hypothetical protein